MQRFKLSRDRVILKSLERVQTSEVTKQKLGLRFTTQPVLKHLMTDFHNKTMLSQHYLSDTSFCDRSNFEQKNREGRSPLLK